MSHSARTSYATHFASRRVAENYRFRPSYSPEVVDTLLSLVAEPRSVLDAGCGPGKLAFALSGRVARVHAIDPSEEMLTLARAQEDGSYRKITWTLARVEEAELAPPYGLIVAGAAIHWMDRDVVLPRFAAALSPEGVLAMVDGDRWTKRLG